MNRWLVAFLAFAVAACATPASRPTGAAASNSKQERPAQPQPSNVFFDLREPLHEPLSWTELRKLADESEVQYGLGEDTHFDVEPPRVAEVLWPAGREAFELPSLVMTDGRPSVVGVEVPPSIRQQLERAEVPFKNKDYAAAERAYRAILAKSPREYMAQLYLGDALLWSGRPQEALAAYQGAEELLPTDHRAPFFESSAYRHLNHREEARRAVARALVLRPRYRTIEEALTANSGSVGARFEAGRLRPRTVVAVQNDRIDLIYDARTPAWMAYGLCRAIWLGEPRHRMAMLGEDAHRPSLAEELECLGALVDAYRSANPMKFDPELDRVVEVVDAGYSRELVLYEVASRYDPHVTLLLGEAARARLQEYVLRFVIPREDLRVQANR